MSLRSWAVLFSSQDVTDKMKQCKYLHVSNSWCLIYKSVGSIFKFCLEGSSSLPLMIQIHRQVDLWAQVVQDDMDTRRKFGSNGLHVWYSIDWSIGAIRASRHHPEKLIWKATQGCHAGLHSKRAELAANIEQPPSAGLWIWRQSSQLKRNVACTYALVIRGFPVGRRFAERSKSDLLNIFEHTIYRTQVIMQRYAMNMRFHKPSPVLSSSFASILLPALPLIFSA